MAENVANIEDEYADIIKTLYRCNEISVADALKHRFEQLVKLNDWANFLDKQLKETDWEVLEQNKLLGEKDKRIAELEAVLKPFGDMAHYFVPGKDERPDDVVTPYRLTIGDLRAARAALEKK